MLRIYRAFIVLLSLVAAEGISEQPGLLLPGALPSPFVSPALAQPQPQDFARMPLMIETDNGFVTLQVEVADTPALRQRGLMFRQRLPKGHGMLLLWDRPGMAALWMKNTLIPLDMIFIDAAGRIVHIHENAKPGDLTPIAAGRPVLAVLELPAGEARRLGLRYGLHVSLPQPRRLGSGAEAKQAGQAHQAR